MSEIAIFISGMLFGMILLALIANVLDDEGE